MMATVQVTDMTTQTILRHAATMVTETTVTVATGITAIVEEQEGLVERGKKGFIANMLDLLNLVILKKFANK